MGLNHFSRVGILEWEDKDQAENKDQGYSQEGRFIHLSLVTRKRIYPDNRLVIKVHPSKLVEGGEFILTIDW